MTMTTKRDEDGTFSYEVHNGFDLIEAGKGYPTRDEAEASAKVIYHELHRCGFVWNKPFLQNDYISMDDLLDQLVSGK